MFATVFQGILIPFLGTSAGAAMVYFMHSSFSQTLRRCLTGFAGGVMVAASVWSLLLPSMDFAQDMGTFAFVPAAVGFWVGVLFLILLDHIIPYLQSQEKADGVLNSLGKDTMLMLAVTLHNIPEGMAVGVVYAGLLAGKNISVAEAMALSIGIALQNFPEGAVLSLPMHSGGMNKHKAFGYGFFSGVVEPIGALLTILATTIVVPILPYMLGFAAGAMIYVVVDELVPEMNNGKPSYLPVLLFAAGFTVMMTMDVVLG